MIHPTIDIERNERFMELHRLVKPYTITSIERQYGLYNAVNYVTDARIKGDFVECGVWKGGSSLLAAKAFLDRGEHDREFWLFDTYDGMTPPGPEDVPVEGAGADHFYRAEKLRVGLDETKRTMALSGYPDESIHYVVGDVAETVWRVWTPERIAILRLDTDWYESTLCELEALYHRVSRGGVVIADDCGHWLGQAKAITAFLNELPSPPLLHRMDYSGVMWVKP